MASPHAPDTEDGAGALSLPLPPPPRPARPTPPNIHHFYRLPFLDPKLILPPFDETIALIEGRPAHGVAYVRNVCSLLALFELKQEHILSLYENTQKVIGLLLNVHHTSVAHLSPHLAISQLGIRFPAMDALLGVIQIVGTSMNADKWWPQVARRVSAEYPGYSLRPRASETNIVHLEFAKKLSAAIKPAKT